MQRRRALFWVSLGLFQLGEALGLDPLDRLAAATINAAGKRRGPKPQRPLAANIAEAEPAETPPEPPVEDDDDGEPGKPSPKRKARHGRPPSRWLRSLTTDELKVWLKTVEPNEAGVSGMTYFTHLTRDHFFAEEVVKGLAEPEQAKLHGAAHDGY